jgi:hypothetical protein
MSKLISTVPAPAPSRSPSYCRERSGRGGDPHAATIRVGGRVEQRRKPPAAALRAIQSIAPSASAFPYGRLQAWRAIPAPDTTDAHNQLNGRFTVR